MEGQTKYEIAVIALSTLAVIPLVAGIGLVVMSGIVTW
jgi:hypothetical protein